MFGRRQEATGKTPGIRALDPDSGAVVWDSQAGPGGTAGGLQWGSAGDDTRVYTANTNSNFIPWTMPDGSTTTDGMWSGLDAVTGEILWQTTPPNGGSTSGPVTTANGLVFGHFCCSIVLFIRQNGAQKIRQQFS